MGNGFEIRCPVPVLNEKSLVVFQAIGCSADSIVIAVRVIILHHLPGPLFEVRSGYHAEVRIVGESGFRLYTVRRLNHDRKKLIGAAGQKVRQYYLALISVPKLRNDFANGIVSTTVTSRGSQDRRDVFNFRTDSQRFG